jgi:hypothetical protein
VTEQTRPLTPELEQAFYDAVYACRDWTHEPDSEPEVYVNPDRLTRHKISSICDFVLMYDNKPLPKPTFEILYRIPDETWRDLKNLFDGNETYHAGAHCLSEWVKHKRRWT